MAKLRKLAYPLSQMLITFCMRNISSLSILKYQIHFISHSYIKYHFSNWFIFPTVCPMSPQLLSTMLPFSDHAIYAYVFYFFGIHRKVRWCGICPFYIWLVTHNIMFPRFIPGSLIKFYLSMCALMYVWGETERERERQWERQIEKDRDRETLGDWFSFYSFVIDTNRHRVDFLF